MYIAAKLVERAAVRMQRLRRLYFFARAAKLVWRRKLAGVTIQRVVRGHFGRLYARLLARVLPLATVRIQRTWRAYKGRILGKGKQSYRTHSHTHNQIYS